MALIEAPSEPPSLADAQTAAAALAEQISGVVGVCVFGSVARGAAAWDSDLDLMVVVDERLGAGPELDGLKHRMESVAKSTIGVDCDVVPVSLRELAWNLRNASSSVYGEAVRDGVWMVPTQQVDWQSIDLEGYEPMSRDDRALAIENLAAAAQKIDTATTSIEKMCRRLANEPTVRFRDHQRFATCCDILEFCHFGIESSLNALGRLELGRILHNKHDINEMLSKLQTTLPSLEKQDVLAAVESILADVPRYEGRFVNWRNIAYIAHSDKFEPMIEDGNAMAHATAAVRTFQYTMDRLRTEHSEPPMDADTLDLLDYHCRPVRELERLIGLDLAEALSYEVPPAGTAQQ